MQKLLLSTHFQIWLVAIESVLLYQCMRVHHCKISAKFETLQKTTTKTIQYGIPIRFSLDKCIRFNEQSNYQKLANIQLQISNFIEMSL